MRHCRSTNSHPAMHLLSTPVPRRVLAFSAFNWLIWGVCSVAVFSQFIGLFSSSMDKYMTVVYGRSPLLPMTPLDGFNDEAYADRAIACIFEGNAYIPKQLSNVLKDPKLTKAVSDSPAAGFRVVKREFMILSPEMYDVYVRVCDRIAFTLTAIQDSCVALGFNTTRDGLRIINGVERDADVLEIPRALPVLIVPYWDNSIHAYYVTPAWDGVACVYGVSGTYQSSTQNYGLLQGVPRSVRTRKAEEWLQKPGGEWRHGWYEDPQGQPWMVNMATSKNGNSLGIEARRFNTLKNRELNCDDPDTASQCQPPVVTETWGKHFTTTSTILQNNQVFISNGKRFGLFLFEVYGKSTTFISYPLETFISNVSIFILLFRWFVSMASMQNSYRKGVSSWQTTGIGCLSSTRTFNVLPIMLLPQLKMLLTIFSSTGCSFEGQQSALTSAWYVMYPGIVELLFYYYSLLNIIGKITYRRISDALFGPTLLVLCAMHFYRFEIAQIEWLGLNERISTVLLSAQVDALKLTDFFTTDVALQLNGNVQWLFFMKLGVLGLSLLPLVLSENMTERSGEKAQSFTACEIEKTLVLRASNVGGLGRSPVYMRTQRWDKSLRSVHEMDRKPSTATPRASQIFQKRSAVEPVNDAPSRDQVRHVRLVQRETHHVLLSYELDRLGYLVFGGTFLMTFEDWYVLSSIAPLRVFERLWNYRVSVFIVTKSEDGMYYDISPHPQLLRLDDPQLRAIPFYAVTVCAFR